MTAAEKLAACLGTGQARVFCDQVVASQMVGGVYCDGTIVIDESGKRCIPRELVDRVNEARAATPLPAQESTESPWALVGLAALTLVAIVWIARR